MKKLNILIVSAFIAGFALMTIELIATRLMAPYVGSSIYTWTSVIGVILLGMAVGNYAGGVYIDRKKSHRSLAMLFIAASVATFFIPLFSYFSPIVALSGLSMSMTTILLAFLLFFIPAVFFGTLYPGILKLHLQTIDATGIRSGQISAAWSLGSIAGTFLTGFYFIGYIGSVTTILLMALLVLTNAMVLARIKKTTIGLIGLLFSIVGMMTYAMYLFADVRGVVFAAESEYYKIRIIDRELGDRGRVRMLLLDTDSHSVEGVEGQHLGTYPEIYPIFGAIHERMQDMLVIGGGSYDLSKKLADFYKGADVTTVEIDPKVQRVADEYFQLNDYPVRQRVGDGRNFLRQTDRRYDLIFSDAYNSFISVPWHMATKEFFEEAKARLNEGGVFAVNFSSVRKGAGEEFFKSMEKTFGLVFENYYVFAFGADAYDAQNIVLVGVNTKIPIGVQELRTKILRGENGAFLAKRSIDRSMTDEDTIILTDTYAPVERLMSPLMNEYFARNMAFYYGMVLAQ